MNGISSWAGKCCLPFKHFRREDPRSKPPWNLTSTSRIFWGEQSVIVLPQGHLLNLDCRQIAPVSHLLEITQHEMHATHSNSEEVDSDHGKRRSICAQQFSKKTVFVHPLASADICPPRFCFATKTPRTEEKPSLQKSSRECEEATQPVRVLRK